MDRWDPMASAYHDRKFNRYNEGVGRDLEDSSGRTFGAKLFVGNIPRGIGNEGLFNLFAEYGTVVEAQVFQSDRDTSYGFVTMRSAVEGERAITKLHQKRLGNRSLKVTVALTKEEKEQRQQFKQRETELMSSLRKDFNWDNDMSSVTSGYSESRRSVRNEQMALGGMGRGIEGIDRYEWHSLSRGQPAHNFPKLAINVGRGAGRQVQRVEYPAIFPLCQGRGRAGNYHGGLLRTPGYGPDVDAFRQQLLFRRQAEMKKRAGQSQFLDIQVPDNPRLKRMKCCTYCQKEGCQMVCSRCRMYYCSVECQTKDWPNHKAICAIFGEYYRLHGGLGGEESSKENGVKHKGKGSETDSDFKKPDSANSTTQKPKGSAKQGSDNSQSPENSDCKSPMTNRSNGLDTSNKLAKGNGDTKSVVKTKTAKQVARDQARLIKFRENKAKPGQNELEQVEEVKGDFVRPLEKQDVNGGKAEAPQDGSGDASYGQVQMTIPVGSSGMAYLTHYENPYKFWISLVEHLEEFTDTTLLISKQAECSPPSNPKPRETYGAMWEGEWARVEVISVSDQEVTVFFMDYGNTGTVSMKDLRPLTLDIIKLPAQALCCCVSKMKPRAGRAWSEEAVALVKEWFGPPMSNYFSFEVVEKRGLKNAVKISHDNEALSELLLAGSYGERDTGEPGLPAMPSVRKQFTINDLKSEWQQVKVGEHLSTALIDLQSERKFLVLKQSSATVLQELEALMAAEYSKEHPCYRPIAGEVVAAIYSADQKWYRSQVLKVEGDTCSLYFVDYGNEEDQVVQNVREIKNQQLKSIPAQALVCCLHGMENLSTSEAETAEFVKLLPDFQVEGALTLSVEAKTENQLIVDIISAEGKSLSQILKDKCQVSGGGSWAEMSEPVGETASVGQSNAGTPRTSPSVNKTSPLAKSREATVKPLELKSEVLPINPDKTVSVVIPYILNCGHFYARPARQTETFEAMMKALNKSVQLRPAFQDPPAVGSIAAVQFSMDKLWYRGRVQAVEPTTSGRCKVVFVDYGNTEVVPWAELKELPASLCELPAQAVRCRLAGDLDGLSQHSNLEFKQYLENETVDIKAVDGDVDSVAVQMVANGVDINSFFFGSEVPEERNAMKIKNLEVEPGAKVKVECVNMTSPSAFYVQVTSQTLAFMEATLNLKTRLEETPTPVSSVSVGDFVASKFSEDEDVIWYRGRVEKVRGDKASIYFVDYGNFEERLKTGLMSLSEEDCAVPAGTLKCRLRSCEKSTPDMDSRFAGLEHSQIDSIQVVSQNEQECVVDLLSADGKCITNMFLPAQAKSPVSDKQKTPDQRSPAGAKPKASVAPRAATSAPPATSASALTASASPVKNPLPTQTIPASSDFTNVTVTHIDSCSSLYILSTDNDLQAKLLELMVALNQTADALPALSRPRQGSVCAACFSQDSSWYRARIVSMNSSTTCTVQFLDYGNSEETPIAALRELPMDDPVFTELPAQAIRCCLSGFERNLKGEPGGKSSQVSKGSEDAELSQLKAELLERPVRIRVASTVGDTLVVEMQNEHQKSINALFTKATVSDEGMPMLCDVIYERTTEAEFDAFMLQLTNLDEFYCHRCDEEEMTELMTMGELLQADVSHLPPGTSCSPVVGGLYASEFQGVWYRCVVEKIVGPRVVIKYIDFGNCEEKPSDELRPLNKRRLEMPVRILKCKLYGVRSCFPDWDHPDMPTYLKLLSEKQPRLKVHGEDKDGALLVSLLIHDGQGMMDVAQDLIKIGIATELTGTSATTKASPQPVPQVEKEEEVQAVGETGDYDDDEMELAKQIELLQKQLKLTKLKKAKTAKK